MKRNRECFCEVCETSFSQELTLEEYRMLLSIGPFVLNALGEIRIACETCQPVSQSLKGIPIIGFSHALEALEEEPEFEKKAYYKPSKYPKRF